MRLYCGYNLCMSSPWSLIKITHKFHRFKILRSFIFIISALSLSTYGTEVTAIYSYLHSNLMSYDLCKNDQVLTSVCGLRGSLAERMHDCSKLFPSDGKLQVVYNDSRGNQLIYDLENEVIWSSAMINLGNYEQAENLCKDFNNSPFVSGIEDKKKSASWTLPSKQQLITFLNTIPESSSRCRSHGYWSKETQDVKQWRGSGVFGRRKRAPEPIRGFRVFHGKGRTYSGAPRVQNLSVYYERTCIRCVLSL